MSCPEFRRQVLEVLRQPLEDIITISRSKMTVCYPTSFMLVASDPCPCGYYNHPTAGLYFVPAEGECSAIWARFPVLCSTVIDIQIEIITCTVRETG